MAEPDDTTTDETTDAPAPVTDEVTAEESAVGDDTPRGAADAAVAAPAEPQEILTPKERRSRRRAASAAKRPARGPRTDAERQSDREAGRAAKAKARRAGRAKAGVKHKAEAHNRAATPPREHVAGNQKVRQGVVVSDKADKTISVRIDVARRHRRYAKVVRTSQTFHAHDESNDAHIGDTVTIRESRPLSATKRWRLVGVVERAR